MFEKLDIFIRGRFLDTINHQHVGHTISNISHHIWIVRFRCCMNSAKTTFSERQLKYMHRGLPLVVGLAIITNRYSILLFVYYRVYCRHRWSKMELEQKEFKKAIQMKLLMEGTQMEKEFEEQTKDV